MIEIWLSSFVAGVVIGVLYFAGLWKTVNSGFTSDRPMFWFVGSLLARVALILVAFWMLSQSQMDRLLMCVLGFTLVRYIAVSLVAPQHIQHI